MKFAMLNWLSGLIILMFGGMECGAADWYVATNGPGGGATNWATATNNIQDAISLCSPGDTVWVSNGVYQTGGVMDPSFGGTGSVLTNRVEITAAITVRSANNDPTNTIIKGRFDTGEPGASGTVTNGPAAVRCVFMVPNSSLIGFTLTNGATLGEHLNGWDGFSGGVACYDYSPIISNCVIAGNSSEYSGGGTYCGTLYNCTIIGNSSANGGGAYNSKFYNCTIANNLGG